ncbi:MAG: universal stress protein [Bacteroidia bacterium]|nr:universal stress protein [Bacteroidia bacterium]
MLKFKSSKILVPVDFSETSRVAINHAGFIAQYTKGDIYLLHVVSVSNPVLNILMPEVHVEKDIIHEKANEKLTEWADEISKMFKVNINTVIKTGNPHKEILATVDELGIDFIAMGTHGYGPIENLIIGSNTLKVATKSNAAVLCTRMEATKKGYNHIILPIDTSANTRQKVNYAAEFAQTFKSHVHVLGLLGADEPEYKNDIQIMLKQTENFFKEKGIMYNVDLIENVKNRATATIHYTLKNNGDIIIVMSDQDAELSGFFLGPYTQQIIHHSTVPVIILKPENIALDTDISILGGTSGI